MWFSLPYPQNCRLQTTDELPLAFTAGELGQRAVAVHLSSKAHSKYVSTFDTDKVHTNKLAKKAVLLRFWEMARGRFCPRNFGSSLISHKSISLTYMYRILKDARLSSLKYSSYLCRCDVFFSPKMGKSFILKSKDHFRFEEKKSEIWK